MISKINKIIDKNDISKLLIIILAFVCIYFLFFRSKKQYLNSQDISNLTDKWIHSVTVLKNPSAVTSNFCNDGILFGTVSQTLRKGVDIEKYFDYFAKLPGLKVLNREYNIDLVSPGVYVNNAFITWQWEGSDPVVARMTFLYRDDCIFELHSSALPDKNDGLKSVS